MKKVIKFFSAVISVILVLGTVSVSTSALQFRDIKETTPALYNAVELLSSLGIVKGTSDTSFGTVKAVTREQMAAFLYRMMKKGKSAEGGENLTSFTDLNDSTYFSMISWADSQGIIKGKSSTSFDPTGNITLQDCYVMITRMLGYEKDGALSYPFDYINIAEQIGLDENISSSLTYKSTLKRGDVVVILYNAFYADMQDTYKKSVEKKVTPYLDKNGKLVSIKVVEEELHETIAHKIYDLEKTVVRVVATPHYGIDLTAVGYSKYPSLASATSDVELVTLAPIADDDYTDTLLKNNTVDFSKLHLQKSADDYFLRDLTLFVNNKGEILSCSASGNSVKNAGKITFDTRSGTDPSRDYLTKGNTSSGKLFSGLVSIGSESGYFFNQPYSVDNQMECISLKERTEYDGFEFVAGYDIFGERLDFSENPAKDEQGNDADRYNNIFRAFRIPLKNGYYSVDYYDSDGDGYVDYLWYMPYTFGKINLSSGDSNKMTSRHTGQSANVCIFNQEDSMPTIYASGAKIEYLNTEAQSAADIGEDNENLVKKGDCVLAYICGPANYIRISEKVEKIKVRTVKISKHGVAVFQKEDNTRFTVYCGDSGLRTLGHIVSTTPTAIKSLTQDRNGQDFNYSGLRVLGTEWEIYGAQSHGTPFYTKPVSITSDVASNYAIVLYADASENKILFQAGGIDPEGVLDIQNYVMVYKNGQKQMVPVARKDGEGNELTNQYLKDNYLNQLCTCEPNDDGLYVFKQIDFSSYPKSNLENIEDSTLEYRHVSNTNATLKKIFNNMYQFVTTDAGLKPCNTFSFDDSSIMVVKFSDDNGDDVYRVFDKNELPDFEYTGTDATIFSKVILTLRNNPRSTTNEYVSFIYAEVDGKLNDYSYSEKKQRIVSESYQVSAEEDNSTKFVYTLFNPFTGEKEEEVYGVSSTGANILGIYKLDDKGKLKDSSSAEAMLTKGSADLVKVTSYDAENGVVFVEGDKTYLADADTVVTFIDRSAGSFEKLDLDILSNTDEMYVEEGEQYPTAYIFAEDVANEDIDRAVAIVIVRD